MKTCTVRFFAAMLPLALVVSPYEVRADGDGQPLYCPGETKQFIGPDGKFVQVDRKTYESWPKAKQDAYRAALDHHIRRLDASDRAHRQAADYVRAHGLEINRMRESALNDDPNLFPYRRGNVDLFRKPEGEMNSAERQAFVKAVNDAETGIGQRLAQKSFNAEFCFKRQTVQH